MICIFHTAVYVFAAVVGAIGGAYLALRQYYVVRPKRARRRKALISALTAQ